MLSKPAIYFSGCLNLEKGDGWTLHRTGKGAVMGAAVCSRACCSAHGVFAVPQVALSPHVAALARFYPLDLQEITEFLKIDPVAVVYFCEIR